MPERYLFEYAVIRIVPRVEREEFLNVGVILYCSKQKFLKTLFTIDEEKIKIFSPEFDVQELKHYLCSFQKISEGVVQGGAIGHLPLSDRFRWLTAVRSTVVQPSPVHPGLCIDAEQTLTKLFSELVL